MPQKIHNIRFGTDGWRGVIAQDFTFANVRIASQAIAEYFLAKARQLKKPAKVFVGFDRRFHSENFAQTVAQVLAANKIGVFLTTEACSTPLVSFVIREKRLLGGVMITASHNFGNFNGIKVRSEKGAPLPLRETRKIEKFLYRKKPKIIAFDILKKAKKIQPINFKAQYFRYLVKYLRDDLIKKRKPKIALDAMFGTAALDIAPVCQKLNLNFQILHAKRDPLFGLRKPEPVKENLAELSALVKKERLDLGLAFDADGDRLAAVDNLGNYVSPQYIFALLLLYLLRLRQMRGEVVKTTAGTYLVDKICAKYRLAIKEVAIGFKNIAEQMQKADVLIGAEEAGGIGVKNYLYERDGLLSGLLLLEMLCAKKMQLTDCIREMEKEFGHFDYLRRDFELSASQKEKVKAILRKRDFRLKKVLKIQARDGVKVIFADHSWLLMRLSGTEPLVRIYAEAGSLRKTENLIVLGKRLLKI
jgi:phosphomannomutase